MAIKANDGQGLPVCGLAGRVADIRDYSLTGFPA